ncbi:MAG TPA: rhomboid family intramembrane serine protease [Acidobacteriaceae bacterium]|nr:rhomboid family intramembrane serine protease [Acidobacteriaceae bacterium]
MGGMIPLGDASRRLQRWPVVTIVLILANIYVFTRELIYGDSFVYHFSAIPVYIVAGSRWWTIFTAMFMHGGWLHIIGNMIFFWAFGPEIEDAMGRWRFLFFYLIGGVVAMLAQIAANPFSRVPNLGASGAIAAVMGAFIVTYPRDRIKTALFFLLFVRITFVPAALLIGFWFLIQLFSAGQVSRNVPMGGVAYLAHVGGFLFGVLTARLWMSRPRRVSSGNW